MNELGELERMRLALAASGDLVYDWTPGDGAIVWTDDPSKALGVGSEVDFCSTQRFHALIDSEAADARSRIAQEAPIDGKPFRLEYPLLTASDPLWVEDCGVCVPGRDGGVGRIVGVLRNITERKLREAHYSWAARYDEMTGHLNRMRLRDHLAQVLELMPVADRKASAYFVVAIDDLAVINETYGFDMADEVIVAIGRRLAETAGPGCAIGRTAGNKFGILVEGCKPSDMCVRAGQFRDAARSKVIPTRNGAVSVSVSVGAVSLPQDARSSQEAMSRAEEALDR
ncbi:MAG: diguanylate cyclase domain-containing protein, partial [Alphaproteobacteria bacterium]